MSYLDIRLCGFLSPRLTPGESKRLGPWQVKVDSLLLSRDGLVNTVFHSRAKHIPIIEPTEGAWAAK